jgi:hypothetical protein
MSRPRKHRVGLAPRRRVVICLVFTGNRRANSRVQQLARQLIVLNNYFDVTPNSETY